MTGGTGVTGVALIRYLLQQNIEIIALIRKHSTREKYLPDDRKLHIIYCNMDEYEHISEQLLKYGEISTFFHLAWDGSRIVDKKASRDDMKLQATNILYSISAVELCHQLKCKTFLVTGSQAEFGNKDRVIDENEESIPENGYGNAKLCIEGMTRIMCHKYGIKHITARLFSVYGPYDGTNSLIYSSIKKLLQGEAPKYTKGEQRWDFLYSFDAAKALYLLSEKGRDGNMYCVASGKSDYLYNYISVLHQICNPELKPCFGELPYGTDQQMFLAAKIDKLKNETGFSPEYSFEQGIREIVRCLRED